MNNFASPAPTLCQEEWMERLVLELHPCVQDGLRRMFVESCETAERGRCPDQYLVLFQKSLRGIRDWTNVMIDQEVARIMHQRGLNYLDMLVTATHVAHLRVLGAVKAGVRSKKIDVNIPNMNVFVHRVYLECMERLYPRTFLFERTADGLQQQQFRDRVEWEVKYAIATTVRRSFPTKQLLESFLESEELEEQRTVYEPEPEAVAVAVPEASAAAGAARPALTAAMEVAAGPAAAAAAESAPPPPQSYFVPPPVAESAPAPAPAPAAPMEVDSSMSFEW